MPGEIFSATTVLQLVHACVKLSLPRRSNSHFFSYGLPPLSKVPDGFSALAEIYGKGANRSPLLVTFGFPLDWVVTLPSQDVNGEDGTIQAGEYAKGDTATFFIVPGEGKVSVSLLYDVTLLCTLMVWIRNCVNSILCFASCTEYSREGQEFLQIGAYCSYFPKRVEHLSGLQNSENNTCHC